MDHNEKDEVPMLTASRRNLLDKNEGSRFNRRTSWTRSSSLSLPTSSFPPYGESYVTGFTGPLRTDRRSSVVQMSGSLNVRSTPQGLYNPTTSALGYNARGSIELSTYNRTTDSELPDHVYGGRNEQLLKSGQLGMCNDPYCTTCPSSYRLKAAQQKYKRTSDIFDSQFHRAVYGDAKGCARALYGFLYPYMPGVINPHTSIVQLWNRFFAISCLIAIFVDPLFFFVLSVHKDNLCIVMNKDWATVVVVFRSITDTIYFFHILLQFRLAYVAPESTVVGAGDLVAHPWRIAVNYFTGYFFIDFFAVLPFPQIIILIILPHYVSSSGANYAKNLLQTAVLIQYIPRLYRFLPCLVGQSSSGFVFESAWANFVINLLTFILSGHIVGSWWYLFGLQRVNRCLRDECHLSRIDSCEKFIDCGYGNVQKFSSQGGWGTWKQYANATACLVSEEGGFSYGIYKEAVILTTNKSVLTRYIYSLFWGFQQISTLAGNQTPSYFVWEVLFTMAIIGFGLLLFALLIGNMQNFLQSLGRRRLEMSLRRRDVEQWMRHRRLPEELRRKVIAAERYNWAATRGANEESLIENLPEDLQRDIRQHLFRFLKKVRIFTMMEEPILDAIRAKLRQRTYIQGSCILYPGGLIEKMVFIVRGKMESMGSDGLVVPLAEGDVCGEELLTWCLQSNQTTHYNPAKRAGSGDSSVNKEAKKIRFYGHRLHCTREVTCLTNVEAFILKADDLEDVIDHFARFLKNPRVQRAIRYESPNWRLFAATQIQVAWRYRKKILRRAGNSIQ